MRKQLLKVAVVALAAIATTPEARAQAIDLIGGARFKVVAPANLQGSRNFTYSYTGTAPWGGDLSTPILNVQVIQAIGNDASNTDSLLCTPAANGTAGIPSLNGKVAIFYRGNCSFSAKAYEAEAAGAVAAIIINNVPGNAVGMASTAGITVNIPVFMLSDVDGQGLMNAIRNGVDTRVTLTKWGTGVANDIAVIPHYNATYHGGAIPFKQLAASNGNPRQYRAFTGDVVANFGTDTAKDMVLTRQIMWTPAGGATTTLTSDTAQLASLAPADSIDLIFNKRYYDLHATGKGRFTLRNKLSSPALDIDSVDDVNTAMVYATDSIYSMTAWDTATNYPTYAGGTRLSSGGLLSWGPLFYTAVGGDYPAKMQFTLATDNVGELIGNAVTTAAFKFNDGANGNPADGLFQDGELSLVGVGYKVFGNADTNRYSSFTVPFDPSQAGTPIAMLDNNSTYWYAVNPSAGTIFIANNNDENPYMRTFISKKIDTVQYYAPQYWGSITDVVGGVSNTAEYKMLPFYATNNNIDSVSVDQTSGYPAMAVHVSTTPPLSVKANTTPLFESLEVFPNPSKGDVSVRWNATKAFGMATITLYNGVGQAVQNVKTFDQQGSIQFSLGHLPAGNYWVVFATEKGIDSRSLKIVK